MSFKIASGGSRLRSLAAAAVLWGLMPPLILSAAAEEPVEISGELVTASRAEEDAALSPGAVTVVRAEDLRGEMRTLPDMIDRVPGLHVVRARGRGAYTVASVRGSTSSQVAVYVDGRLRNLESESAVDLSAIQAGDVERIEVYKGYIPSRFPQAGIGGVINIVTRLPEKTETTLTAGYGSYGDRNVRLGVSAPAWGGNLFASAGYSGYDGDFSYRNDNGTPYNSADDYDARRGTGGFEGGDFLLKWRDEHWQADMSWSRMDRKLPVPAPGMDKPDSPRGAEMDTQRFESSVSRRQRSGVVDWGWRADYVRQSRTYDDPRDILGGFGEGHNEYRAERFGLGADASFAAGEHHFIEMSAGWSNETLDAGGDIVSTFGGRDHFSRTSWHAALQDSISLSRDGTLMLTPSIRWDEADGTGKFGWAAALTKQLGSAWTVKASFGSYTRAPNMYERWGDGATIRPNKDIKWETGTQWDLGVMWVSGAREDAPSLSAGLTYFGRRTDNMIEFIMSNPRYGVYQNIAEAEVHGLELEAAAEWRGWALSFSGTWMDARNVTPDSWRSDRRLPNAPRWAFTARLTRDLSSAAHRRGSAFVEAQFTGNNYFDQDEQVRYDDLLLLNAGLKWSFTDNLEMTLGAFDLLDNGPDIKLISGGADRMSWYPLAGRSVYMTLRWQLN